MCAGAAYWTRIGKIVYGSPDPKKGYSLISKTMLHPKTTVKRGVLKEECGEILVSFFDQKRNK